MNSQESEYLNLVQACSLAESMPNRTGVPARSIFGHQLRFDLTTSFPLLTTKKVGFKTVATELLWFISGSTDVRLLQACGVSIWDEWATAEQCARFGRKAGDLGPVYGHQWRRYGAVGKKPGLDQLGAVLHGLKTNPHGRRHIVTGWNPNEADEVTLPPCHTLFQFHVGSNNRLSCHLYQRSADIFLGVPYNIASYALLTCLVAHAVGMKPGQFIHSFGDVHLYENHIEQARTQMDRTPFPFPKLVIDLTQEQTYDLLMRLEPEPTEASIAAWRDRTKEVLKRVWITDYDHHAPISAPVAV